MRYRAIWISDLHIGSKDFKLELLVDFLDSHRCDILYLVGDIVDLRLISRRGTWIRRHEQALQRFFAILGDTTVHYLWGNHDSAIKLLPPFSAPNFVLHQETVHETAQGQRLLVTHGDRVDPIIRRDAPEWKVDLACWFYYGLLALDRWHNRSRQGLGLPLSSQVALLKRWTPGWRRYLDSFVGEMTAEARRANLDGVVCGHLHAPEIRDNDGFLYVNCGDWVENCTAAVEDTDGSLKLIRWDRIGGNAGG